MRLRKDSFPNSLNRFIFPKDKLLQLRNTAYGTKYSRINQSKFVEDSRQKNWRVWSALSRPYPFNFYKGCLPQILLSPFLNTYLSRICFSKKLSEMLIRNLSKREMTWNEKGLKREIKHYLLNPFNATSLFLYPLKTWVCLL